MAEKKIFKFTAKVLLGLLGLWAFVVPILYMFGITIHFPFIVTASNEIPYHRLLAVRTSVFFTFSYFVFRFLFIEYSKLYPIQFLDIFLKSLTLSGLVVFLIIGVEIREYVYVIFFCGCSIITHAICGKKFRKYFN